MKILLSCGELSGDSIGAVLAKEFQKIDPRAELAGCTGPKLRDADVATLASATDFAHSGWSSVLANLPWLVWKAWFYSRKVEAFSPDLVVVLDAPGLHTPLVRWARRKNIPVAWVAPPQLWAWKDRSPKILNGLLVYPLHQFEMESMERVGAKPYWWGYPGPRPPTPPVGPKNILALLPGSRTAWRHRHRPLFAQAAALADLDLETVFVHPQPPASGKECGLRCLTPQEAFPNAALALTLPGTATLELGLWSVPGVVAACPGALDLFLAKRRLSDGYRALPNRILNQPVFPEFYHHHATAGKLGEELARLFEARHQVQSRLRGLSSHLGSEDAAPKIARSIWETLARDW